MLDEFPDSFIRCALTNVIPFSVTYAALSSELLEIIRSFSSKFSFVDVAL